MKMNILIKQLETHLYLSGPQGIVWVKLQLCDGFI